MQKEDDLEHPIELRTGALLSVQRALLGMVTANMRSVRVRWSPHQINIRIIFDGEPSYDDALNVSEIETEVIADYPADFSVVAVAEASDPNQRVPPLDGEAYVFERAEQRDC